MIDKKEGQFFLELLEKHKGILHKICKIYTNDEEDKKDLFQEMIYQLWKSYPSFKGKSQFSSWLYKVCLNTAILHVKTIKKKGIKAQAKIDEIPESAPSEKTDRLELFLLAIKSLNDIEKAIIFLYMEGEPQDFIARQLGYSYGNMRVKINRIKQKLRQRIKTLTNEN